MNNLLTWLTIIFDWVAKTSLMASIIVVLILLVRAALKDRLPIKWQYMLWFVLLARMLLPWVPESSISLYNLFSFADKPVTLSFSAMDDKVSRLSAERASAINESSRNLDKSISGAERSDVTINDSPAFIHSALSLSWLLGVLAMTAYVLVSNRKFSRRMMRESYVVSDEDSLRVLQQCREDLKIKRTLPLLISNGVSSPTLYGVLRPKILLPGKYFAQFRNEELRHILLHEFVHYIRKDIVTNWLFTILLILNWFNPILWYASRKMREDQELSCDDRVISCLEEDEVKQYGYTIVKLVEANMTTGFRSVSATSFSTDKSLIKRRINMIALFKRGSYKWTILGIAIISIFACIALTNAAADKPEPKKSEILELYANEPLFNQVNEKIRNTVKQTVSDVMQQLGKPLPLQEIMPTEDTKDLFLVFKSSPNDGPGQRYIWVNADTGKLSRVQLGLDLTPEAAGSELLKKAAQALQDSGYKGNPYFKISRTIFNDPNTNEYTVQTKLIDNQNDHRVEVRFSNDTITTSYDVGPDQISDDENKKGQYMLAVLRGKKADQLTAASKLFSDSYNTVYLSYGSDGGVSFDPKTYKIRQIYDSSLSTYSSNPKTSASQKQKKLEITDEQLQTAAFPLVAELLGYNLHEYEMQRNPKAPGSAQFVKDGERIFAIEFNENGDIWMINDYTN
ncbi:M56 family metallopeptidase [Paenibacillus sp. MER 180]|uniref:M56 family metallopeptidase n=1 Tax=Paenibacillus sp. MER 180 TaxID=2939570 RepID=UPI00203C7F3C|nr:M56 family metallopeptidase [Paenibacillus sp. MER 180]MCM3293208.1 M56 family metallopeptidase [Paenibacillus sp. MER 180]